MSRTIDVDVVADCTSDRYRPLNRTVCEERHLPILLSQLVELLRLLLKLCAVDNLGQVFHEPLVVHLFVEIARVHLESSRESSRRVAMTEVQETIRLTWIFAIGQLGGDVADAIVLDVLHEQTVPHENAINVEQK